MADDIPSDERWIPAHTCGDPDGLGICDACAAIESYRPTSHAFWGTDPSGYCNCVDCNAPDPNG